VPRQAREEDAASVDWNSMNRHDVAWSGVEWRGVAWRGVEWSGVEWSGVARRRVEEINSRGGAMRDGAGQGRRGFSRRLSAYGLVKRANDALLHASM